MSDRKREFSFWVIYKGSLYHSIHLSIKILLWMHVHFWQNGNDTNALEKLKYWSLSIKIHKSSIRLVFKFHCSSVLTRHTLSYITHLLVGAELKVRQEANLGLWNNPVIFKHTSSSDSYVQLFRTSLTFKGSAAASNRRRSLIISAFYWLNRIVRPEVASECT